MHDICRCHVYGILDLGYVSRENIIPVAKALVKGGVDILQLRAKDYPLEEIALMGREVCKVTREANVPFILNDHPHLAAEIGADGVHVGQDDDSVAVARAIVGGEGIVGKSTHSLEQARAAAEEPLDYIGFGPLFATPTKPEYKPIGLDDVSAVHRLVRVPVFCIGGVKKENLPAVVAAGARRVVIVSGILQSNDIASYIAECRSLLAPQEKKS